MKTVIDLQPELKSLDEKYRELHSNLIKAKAAGDEREIINILSEIHLVARAQAGVREKLDENK